MKKITDTDFIVSLNEDLPSAYKTSRYNGGWVKTITGIDKEKSNGFSLRGNFVDGGKEAIIRCRIGVLYLDCDISGSRKNQCKYYTLFTIDADGKIIVLVDAMKEHKSWAIDLWPEIEKFLDNQPKIESIETIIIKKQATKSALKELSSDSLISELQNRGYDVSSLLKNIKLQTIIPGIRNIEMDERG
jgi:hypothetical protein